MADETAGRRRYRALAFSGGGFDTIMQLGAAHALLVARGRAPDTIIGISAGAINATAVAEILQAGEGEADRLAIQTDRLREYINAYCEVPRAIADAIIPDSLEVIAKSPLEPLESPLHFRKEREDRERANEAKAGLIELINDLFKLRLPFHTITIMVRRILGRVEAREKPTWWRRYKELFRNELGLLAMAWRHVFQVAPLALGVAWRAFHSDKKGKRRRKRAQGSTAAGLIFKRRRVRAAIGAVKVSLQVMMFLPILLFVTAVWVLLYAPGQLVGVAIAKRKHGGGGDLLDTVIDRILGYYGLRDGLGNSDVLRQQLVRCFDPHYYGDVRIDEVLTRALRYDQSPAAGPASPKTVGYYSEKREPRIDLAPVAANVATGALEVIPANVPIVDALMAATAVAPIFPAVAIPREGSDSPCWYIDGINVSSQPIGPLMEHLRERLRPPNGSFGIVDVYPVSALPVSRGVWKGKQEYRGVLEVASRAMGLKRLRDATLEQRMTELYSVNIRDTKALVSVRSGGDEICYVRANVIPIDLDEPPEINIRVILNADAEKLHDMMLETIAGGCRAAMEAFVSTSLKKVVDDPSQRAQDDSICKQAIYERFGAHTALPGVPGHRIQPGLPEICEKCTLGKPLRDQVELERVKGRLRTPPACEDWPRNDEPEPGNDEPKSRSIEIIPQQAATSGGLLSAGDGATVSMLFGGGVFRGVFHMGVVNGLSELRLLPNVVAGSSVGSIVAAMIAQVFTSEDVDMRKAQIARLAATFLAIDKLILTDRFADFIRRTTLRASEMHFSLYDLDRVFRRFDADPSLVFADRVRKVAAGFERMLYVSPFELRSLTQKYREERLMKFKREIQQDLQEFLDRGGIGVEILGSEPLRTLIEHFVLRPLKKGNEDLRDIPLQRFLDPPPLNGKERRKVHFFATATDMSRGGLETLSAQLPGKASMLFSLLASSAFPAVFRPRRAWEVLRTPDHSNQYIDGGVIDNLPLDAVAYFLNDALVGEARRPNVPHLLFTATLEVDKSCYKSDSWEVEVIRRSCRRLSARAASFSYNLKIDAYARVQRDLRRLYEQYRDYWERNPMYRAPLDLHVIAAKPQWLCGTFGFHPMLGFQRRKQAASIAHGCASTMATLYAHWKHPQDRFPGADPQRWVETWLGADGTKEIAKINPEAVLVTYEDVDPGFPSEGSYRGPSIRMEPQRRRHGEQKEKPDGECWFRDGVPCPFSGGAIEKLAGINDAERAAMVKELPHIYSACAHAANHRGAGT